MCFVAGSGWAQEAWLEESRRIIEESTRASPPEWLRTQAGDKSAALAQEVADAAREQLQEGTAIPSAERHRLLIFGSLSLPEPTLRALLNDATDPAVTFVLRGVPSGASIPEVIRRLRRLSPEERVPNVVIDPTLFRRYGVSVVPTMALERADGLAPVLVVGAVTVDWVRRQAASVVTSRENLGRRGEAFKIGEPDLIEEMQRRVASIDWAARREAAIKNFWKRPHEFVDLPDATAEREFLIDPSVRVTQDLQDADGQLLVRAGQSFNPLDWVSPTKTIVVFRGTDSRHVAKALQAAQAARVQGRGTILLTTTVDIDRGWEQLQSLEQQLQGTVYVLPSTLAERFHLAHVPAVVTVKGKQLLVTELPVKE